MLLNTDKKFPTLLPYISFFSSLLPTFFPTPLLCSVIFTLTIFPSPLFCYLHPHLLSLSSIFFSSTHFLSLPSIFFSSPSPSFLSLCLLFSPTFYPISPSFFSSNFFLSPLSFSFSTFFLSPLSSTPLLFSLPFVLHLSSLPPFCPPPLFSPTFFPPLFSPPVFSPLLCPPPLFSLTFFSYPTLKYL